MLFDHSFDTTCSIKQQLRQFHRINEQQAVDHILPLAEFDIKAKSRAWERARKMVVAIREKAKQYNGIDALLNEYSLSSDEGLVLMCLAEALLRVPDKQTQDELIRDKILKGHWSSHLGASDSMFVNASSWGLLLTGSMAKFADGHFKHDYGIVKRTLGKLSEPVIRKAMNVAMKIMGKQFVMGETIQAACERAKEKEQQGYVYSYDMLGEGARTKADAERYLQAYVDAIHVIGHSAQGRGPRLSPGISIKLSALHPRYHVSHYQQVMSELCDDVLMLCQLAKKYDIGLTIDAEESERLEISLDIIEKVFSHPSLEGWQGFGLAVQAYQKRATFVIEFLRKLTVQYNRKMMVRLVKGAYWDTEIKQAQKEGLTDYPVFTRKSTTDVSYHACANKLLEYRDTIYPQFATHNAYSASVIIELAGEDKKGFEFQCLHGMGDTLYDQIVSDLGIQCRVYAPVGQHEDLLAYLVRRLLENGANSSFVNAIVDENKPVEQLLDDPIEVTQRLDNVYNTQIPLPNQLFSDRVNSSGADLNDYDVLSKLKSSLASYSIIDSENNADTAIDVVNPADNKVLTTLTLDSNKSMLTKLTAATNGFSDWKNTSVAERQKVLNTLADLLEDNRDELIHLCIQEAGKTLADSVDEVREAVDFCRYYAQQINENSNLELEPRGVILCISPWNFPLAIFLGQVVAALVTGNAVIAKPAEQTSIVAIKTQQLIYQAGLPKDVLQLVVAKGPDVGETLLPQTAIQGVMFTGSTVTGEVIAKALAARADAPIPLIAETGGQNCMIVDSTALPEQVVDDVINSGFQSAGQRCSALRVLFVQEDIADGLITMIKGAMKELHIGLPSDLSTDVGPVIDKRALSQLKNHHQLMEESAKVLYQAPIGETLSNGNFFAPSLYEIDSIEQLKQEVFGPCVHVVRFKGEELTELVNKINSTGFGLTMGIHSRIESRTTELAKLSNAGNIYINRNMIGAVVGVQPFGGRGLSGTGPKAGGPNYLLRLQKERQVVAAVSDASFDVSQVDDSYMVNVAFNDQQQWRLQPLNDRLSLMRQLLAKLAVTEHTVEFADDLEHTMAAARAQLIDIEKLIAKPTVLPGPTGESNTLYYEARGTLLCYADKSVSYHYWLLSLITGLACGNSVITVVSDLFYPQAKAFRDELLLTGAPKGLFQVAKLSHLDSILANNKLAGVVVEPSCPHVHMLNNKLAERKGAIIPVLSPVNNQLLIKRLLTEKTVSIDTTASGGNTALMTLEV